MKNSIVFLFLVCALSVSAATYTSDGTMSDTQSKVNSAVDGDTVVIPNGSYTWSGTLTIFGKGIVLKGESFGGVTITSSKTTDGGVIEASKDATHNLEIYNLNMVANSNPSSDISKMFLLRLFGDTTDKPFLVHHCRFQAIAAWNHYNIEVKANGGVIWLCNFYSTYSDSTGISFVVDELTWGIQSYMGMDDTGGTHNIYVEDCYFDVGWGACMNPDSNSRVVIRSNYLHNASISPHGADTGPYGVRTMEVYNVRFVYDAGATPTPSMNYWAYIRGGPGVWTDCIMDDIPFKDYEFLFLCQQTRRNAGPDACVTVYPAFHQVGQSWSGGIITDPFCVWNNTRADSVNPPVTQEYEPDECGNNTHVWDFIQEDRDYKQSAKTGWIKYTYPHPSRTDLGVTPVPSRITRGGFVTSGGRITR